MNLLQKITPTSIIVLTMMVAACAPVRTWERGDLKAADGLRPIPFAKCTQGAQLWQP